jgi:hypothetical protein
VPSGFADVAPSVVHVEALPGTREKRPPYEGQLGARPTAINCGTPRLKHAFLAVMHTKNQLFDATQNELMLDGSDEVAAADRVDISPFDLNLNSTTIETLG